MKSTNKPTPVMYQRGPNKPYRFTGKSGSGLIVNADSETYGLHKGDQFIALSDEVYGGTQFVIKTSAGMLPCELFYHFPPVLLDSKKTLSTQAEIEAFYEKTIAMDYDKEHPPYRLHVYMDFNFIDEAKTGEFFVMIGNSYRASTVLSDCLQYLYEWMLGEGIL